MNEREAVRKALRENPVAYRILKKAVDEGKLKSTDDLPETEEEAVFICGPDHGGIDGSKQAQCACGNLVWLSPSSQEVITRRGDAPIRIICMRCAIAELKSL
jgi:hypothetical protein